MPLWTLLATSGSFVLWRLVALGLFLLTRPGGWAVVVAAILIWMKTT